MTDSSRYMDGHRAGYEDAIAEAGQIRYTDAELTAALRERYPQTADRMERAIEDALNGTTSV